MRKNIALFTVGVTILAISLLAFTGCMNNSSANSISYDTLLQLPKTYIGEPHGILYESFNHYKTEMFSENKMSGAIASVECIDTTFYITVRHDGEDIMLSGKAIAKCKVTALKETFNNFSSKSNSIVEVEQNYYIMPTNEHDTLDMLESFGAVLEKDETGEIIGMDINDGDYVLKYQEGVAYTLKIRPDTLPLEKGKSYTGVIISCDGKSDINFLSPVESTQRYEGFQMSQSVKNIAAEIKGAFVN